MKQFDRHHEQQETHDQLDQIETHDIVKNDLDQLEQEMFLSLAEQDSSMYTSVDDEVDLPGLEQEVEGWGRYNWERSSQSVG